MENTAASPHVDIDIDITLVNTAAVELVDGGTMPTCILHTVRGSQVHALGSHEMVGSMGRVGAAGAALGRLAPIEFGAIMTGSQAA